MLITHYRLGKHTNTMLTIGKSLKTETHEVLSTYTKRVIESENINRDPGVSTYRYRECLLLTKET